MEEIITFPEDINEAIADITERAMVGKHQLETAYFLIFHIIHNELWKQEVETDEGQRQFATQEEFIGWACQERWQLAESTVWERITKYRRLLGFGASAQDAFNVVAKGAANYTGDLGTYDKDGNLIHPNIEVARNLPSDELNYKEMLDNTETPIEQVLELIRPAARSFFNEVASLPNPRERRERVRETFGRTKVVSRRTEDGKLMTYFVAYRPGSNTEDIEVTWTPDKEVPAWCWEKLGKKLGFSV